MMVLVPNSWSEGRGIGIKRRQRVSVSEANKVSYMVPARDRGDVSVVVGAMSVGLTFARSGGCGCGLETEKDRLRD
jgi:hypothetical protein